MDSEGSEISLDDADLDELDEKAGRPAGSGGDGESENIVEDVSRRAAGAGGGVLEAICFLRVVISIHCFSNKFFFSYRSCQLSFILKYIFI